MRACVRVFTCVCVRVYLYLCVCNNVESRHFKCSLAVEVYVRYQYTNCLFLVHTGLGSYSNTANVVDVSCGAAHSVAICQDGAVYAWGSNSAGQCGPFKAPSMEEMKEPRLSVTKSMPPDELTPKVIAQSMTKR